jgi:hypothetical protein
MALFGSPLSRGAREEARQPRQPGGEGDQARGGAVWGGLRPQWRTISPVMRRGAAREARGARVMPLNAAPQWQAKSLGWRSQEPAMACTSADLRINYSVRHSYGLSKGIVCLP